MNRFQVIKNILSDLLNEDTAYLIVDELKFQESLLECKICNKFKHLKQFADIEYICSELCGFCGICINSSNECFKCLEN